MIHKISTINQEKTECGLSVYIGKYIKRGSTDSKKVECKKCLIKSKFGEED